MTLGSSGDRYVDDTLGSLPYKGVLGGGGDAFWVRGFVFLFVGECSFGKVSGSFYLLLFLLMTTILVLVRLSSDYSWLRFHLSFLNVQ